MKRQAELTSITIVLAAVLGLQLLVGLPPRVLNIVNLGDQGRIDTLLLMTSTSVFLWGNAASLVLYFLAVRRTDGLAKGLFGAALLATALGLLHTMSYEFLIMMDTDMVSFHTALAVAGNVIATVGALSMAWAVWAIGGQRARPASTGLAVGTSALQLVAVSSGLLQLFGIRLPEIVMQAQSFNLIGVFVSHFALVVWVAISMAAERDGEAANTWVGSMLITSGLFAQVAASIHVAVKSPYGYAHSEEMITASSGISGLAGTAMLAAGMWLLSQCTEDAPTTSFRVGTFSILSAGLLNLVASGIFLAVIFGLDRDAKTLALATSGVAGLLGFVAMMAMLSGFQKLGAARSAPTLAVRAKRSQTALWVIVGGTFATAVMLGVTPSAIVGGAFATAVLLGVTRSVIVLLPALVVLGGALVALFSIPATLASAFGLEPSDRGIRVSES